VDGGRDEVEAAQPTDLEVVLRPEARGAARLPTAPLADQAEPPTDPGIAPPPAGQADHHASDPAHREPAKPVRPTPSRIDLSRLEASRLEQVDRVDQARGEPARPPAVASQQLDLVTAVERLRMQVATLSLTLDVPEVVAARREREGLLSQLDDYLLPRLRRRDAPLLAVIGGSTGAGKSTLTNSLVRRMVSRSGVLRPTTRSPVLVHHPFDSGAFLSQRILPRLTRVTSEAPEPLQPIDPNAPRITGLRLVPHDGLAPGMAIIDAPDIDSLVETNRDLAVQLLQAATCGSS